MAPLAQLPVRQLSSASPCTSSTRAGNESCNAAVLQAKPWHRGRSLVAQPLQQRRQVVERYFHGCQASSNVSFAVETPGSPGKEETLEIPSLRHKLMARPSPFTAHNNFGGGFVFDEDRVALNSMHFGNPASAGASCRDSDIATSDLNGRVSSAAERSPDDSVCVPLPPWAMRAGARETIYFNPAEVNVAIVTCGGLCPGLNDVVQGLVNKLSDYGVPDGHILGIKYGYRGFYDRDDKPVVLTRRSVDGIQLQGGTILGTSRGGADIKGIVKQVDMWGIDMVFVVGGNGGNAGANAIQCECEEQGVVCSVIGIPKSIDNDILLIDKCFGFDTAVEQAQEALLAAKVEAGSAYHGIGVVKLMGRSSGFIAMQASLASGVVDVCLIPEVKFDLQGDRGLLNFVQGLLDEKGHCVVCIAEGAGQDLLKDGKDLGRDASGNAILADVGPWLRDQFRAAFRTTFLPMLQSADVKYIDPSYIIRTVPTISNDRIYCKILAHNAVHAAFGGYTGITVGLVNTHYVYLPIPTVISAPRKIDPNGKMWNRLRASIGQPTFSNATNGSTRVQDGP